MNIRKERNYDSAVYVLGDMMLLDVGMAHPIQTYKGPVVWLGLGYGGLTLLGRN